MMFLFWIFRTKNVSRMPCCLVNIFCHAKPIIVVLVAVQIIILTAIVLHLRGSFDLVNKWNHHSPAPPVIRFSEQGGPVNAVFHLIDNEAVGFEPHGKTHCFTEGTMPGGSECKCREGWHGADCGLHNIIWYVKGLQLKRRAHPRRIIHAFPAGSSTDLMEIRFQELRHAVDVFIVAEKNRTTAAKLPVLTRLSRGWLQDFHDRILYVHHNESHPLHVLSEEVQHHLSNVRTDDIIVFASSEEIPAAEVLHTLKWYDGFPEMLAIFYQQSVYNFYSIPNNATAKYDPVSPSVTTVQYFLKDCNGKGSCLVQRHPNDLIVLGSSQHPAGWRCTLCFQQLGSSVRNYSHNIKMDKTVRLPKFLLKNEKRYWYLLHTSNSPHTHLNVTRPQNKTVLAVSNDIAQTTVH